MSAQWPDPQQGYWNDPAGGYEPTPGGQPDAAWGQGYPQAAYGAPPYPPGYPQPYPGAGTVEEPPSTGGLIGAMVVAVITMLICQGTNIIGVILVALALGKRTTNPYEARKFGKYAWISNWIHLGLILLGVALFAAAIATDA
ncbi:hypothetical protein CDO52_05115 [Nocardiopsis gilva YIM 90087]|uniref:DUF4190 domain-containing protein n=1 Tax=Nocardiopsis gilva YIM 90087 TaxID=1235441 RepID=A0A223S2A8_9ACTN|nr:hypothetical protein [Nocardiopsis gilva]ASU82248.1 hypothetical protein CDO52_05115 [Nocardiopsis gilva YIM 90087]